MSSSGSLPIERLMDAGATVADSLEAATAALLRYEELWSAADWAGLQDHAATLAGLSDAIHRQIAARARLADLERDRLAAEDRALRDTWSALAEDGSAEAVEAKEALLAELVETLGSTEAAEAERARLLSATGPLFERASSFASRVDGEEDELADLHASLRALAARADYVGLVQQGAELARATQEEFEAASEGIPAPGLQPGDVQLLSETGEALSALVEDGFARLYAALKEDAALDAFAAMAGECDSRARAGIGVLARLLGSSLHLASWDGGDPEARAAFRRAALTASGAAQRASLLTAYAGYAGAHAVTRSANRWYGHERRRTDARQLASIVPQGVPVPVAALQETDLPAGELVHVEGLVTAIEILDDPAPPKFSTFVDLADPEGGSLRVRAHMFSLINNGLAAGCWCALRGQVRRGEPWLAAGETGLDAFRVPLGEFRSESWLDDIAFRMRPYFTLYMDQMDMIFTPAVPLKGE